MDPVASNICFGIFLAFLLQALIAVAYLNRAKLNALSANFKPKVKLLWRHIRRTEARLEGEIARRQQGLEMLRSELIEVNNKERRLTKLVTAAAGKNEQLRRRASRKSDEFVRSKADKQNELTNKLAAELARQKGHLTALRLEIRDSECIISVLRAKIALMKAETTKDRASEQRTELLSTLSSRRVQAAISRLELKVLRSECGMVIMRASSKPVTSLSRAMTHMQKYEREVLEREIGVKKLRLVPDTLSVAERHFVEGAATSIYNTIDLLNLNSLKLRSVVSAIDPNMNRAYERVSEQLKLARKLAERSLREEEELNRHLSRRNGELESLSAESSITQTVITQTPPIHNVLAEREAERAELVMALRNHRKRNIWIDQQLFRADCIVRRLHTIKLLLSALPRRSKDDLSTYKRIIIQFGDNLRDAWQREFTVQELIPGDLNQSMIDLESKVQMAYINLAKGGFKELSKHSVSQLRKEFAEISKTLESEILLQKNIFDNWKTVSAKALQEGRELAHDLASQRKEQSALLLRTLQRSLEVISVTASALNLDAEKIRSKPETAVEDSNE